MNKALACCTGGWGSNPGQDQDFYVSEKFKNVLYSSQVPHHMNSLFHIACCHVLQHEYLSQGRLKERNHGKAIEINLLLIASDEL